MLISTALLLDSIIRNSVCTPAKLPCRRVEVGYEKFRMYLFAYLYRIFKARCSKTKNHTLYNLKQFHELVNNFSNILYTIKIIEN
jgi:hypothetical protein